MTENTTASGAANAGLHALADRIEEAQGRAICISVESADYLREALAASAPVAPTQPASKRLIGWRTPDYLEETADAAMAKNWSVHHDLLPIFEGDVHTKLATPQAAPVAPAPQPAPMPYPTDAQVDAVYEQTMGQHLRSQDAPAVRRFGRAIFFYAWNSATQAAPAPQPVPQEWLSDQSGGDFDDMTAGQGYRKGWNDCRARMLAAAPKAAPAINKVSDIIDAHGMTPGQPERVADIPGLAEIERMDRAQAAQPEGGA